jgi:hypothetical protein
MLQDGKITADQAMELLAAMEPVAEAMTLSAQAEAAAEESEATTEETILRENPAVLMGDVIKPGVATPDMDRLRRFWQAPFFIALGTLILTGLALRSLYQASNGAVSLWFFCVLSIFVIAFALTTLAFLSRRASWVHVRVQEKGGKRIAISLPLPLSLAGWGLNVARGFAKDNERQRLDMASEFVAAARDSLKKPGAEPLMINVDEDDGDQVQIFIG